MQRTRGARRLDDARSQPRGALPKPRSATVDRDRPDSVRPVEDEVARLADVVLKVWALADRYEARLHQMAPGHPGEAERQTRVDVLRTTAERGRNRLQALAGSG